MKSFYKKMSILLTFFFLSCNILSCSAIIPIGLNIFNNEYTNITDDTSSESTSESILMSTVSDTTTNTTFTPYTEYNELGRVPIMMYHGIENIKSADTKFVGGNVDIDGYNRTAEAFREDLEFFYNSGYRMIRLIDYVNGIIDCPAGYSPIIITFDDGYENNIKINKINADGTLNIDKDSAVGILEEMKEKYPDFNVTATFFLTGKLFRNNNSEKSMKWLIENGYDIGNHTYSHIDLTTRDENFAIVDVALQYERLDEILGPNKAVNIVALPLGKPYDFEDKRAYSIIDFFLGEKYYHTASLMRVGYAPERSPYDKNINIFYLMRVRAYDNNGEEYDIESTFNKLNETRFISDGNINTITIKKKDLNMLGNTYDLSVISY